MQLHVYARRPDGYVTLCQSLAIGVCSDLCDIIRYDKKRQSQVEEFARPLVKLFLSKLLPRELAVLVMGYACKQHSTGRKEF